MVSDAELRNFIIKSMQNGTVKTHEMIMRKRILLHITPKQVNEAFRKAYDKYKERQMMLPLTEEQKELFDYLYGGKSIK